MSAPNSQTANVCPRCKGAKQVPVEDGMDGTIMSCPDCEGSGMDLTQPEEE